MRSIVSRHTPLSLAIASLTMAAAVIASPTFADDGLLEEVVVTGSYNKSLQSAIESKRNSDSVIDSIVSEDIGKFPAQNIAEALQRVTGVSIVRDRGEGVYVRVRGLGSNFQVTTLNGNTMAVNENVRTSGQFGRQFRFDTLPAELVSAVEVIKSPTADLDEGAIGGTVNIKTFRPLDLDSGKVSLSAQANRNDLAEQTDPRVSGLVNWVNDEKNFGVLVSAAYAERSVRQDRVIEINWTEYDQGFDIDGDGSADTGAYISPNGLRPTLELEDRKRFGVSTALEWQPSDNLDIFASVFYVDQKVNYDEFTYSADFSPSKLTPGSAVFRGNALVGGSTQDGAVQIGRESSGIRDENLAYNLGATWALDAWTIAASAFYSSANSADEDPIIRTRFRKTSGVAFDFLLPGVDGKSVPSINYHNADLLNASEWPGRRLEWRTIEAEDTEQAIKLDVSRTLDSEVFSQFSAGIKLRDRERDYFRRDLVLINGVEGEVFDDSYFTHFPVSGFLGEASGSLPQTWLVPNESLFWAGFPSAEVLSQPLSSADLRNSYHIEEKINAAYAMVNMDTHVASLPLKGNVGVRVVKTEQTSSGHASADGVTTPVSFNSDYTNVLPSVNFSLNVSDDLVTRFAAAKVVTRADLQDMAPKLTFNSGDRLTASGGNPHLKPFEAWQYDLTLEWYPNKNTALTSGVFYKDIATFIQTQKSDLEFGGQVYELSSKVNGSNAEVKGIELAYQQVFDFLPGAWSHLGVQANYTWTDSSAVYVDGSNRFSGKLEDVAKNSYNLTAFYEKDALSLRVGYSWRDGVVNEIGTNSRATKNKDAFGSLDASASYDINDIVSVYAEAINLTGEAEQEYVDGNQFGSYTYYGKTFGVGVRANF